MIAPRTRRACTASGDASGIERARSRRLRVPCEVRADRAWCAMLRRLPRVLVLLVLGACSSTSSPAGNGGFNSQDGGSTNGTSRSSTCIAWQKAECDFIADRCKQMSRADCDDQFSAIFCTSDDGKLSACMQVLPTATCGTTPMACGGTLDAAPAIAACNAYLERVCAHDVKCMAATKDECLTAAKQQIDCSRAVGAKPALDACFTKLDALACGTTALPDECKGAILVSQGANETTPPGTTVLSVQDALATPTAY